VIGAAALSRSTLLEVGPAKDRHDELEKDSNATNNEAAKCENVKA